MRLDATAGVCLAFLCAFQTLIALLSLQYSLNRLKIHIIDFTIHDYPTVGTPVRFLNFGKTGFLCAQ